MIAGKLIFQSLAGVAAVGSIGGVVIATTNKETKPVVNEDKEANKQTVITPKVNNSPSTNDFYLVSSGNTLTTNTQDLWTDESTKNYKCVNAEITNKEIDEICILYSLTANNNKTIEMSKIQDFIKNESLTQALVKKTESKTEITTNKFFLLKANSSLFPETKLDASEEIKLINKTENVSTQTNTFGNFKVHAKISKDSITGKTDWLIGKTEKVVFSHSTNIANKTASKECWKGYFGKNEECLIFEVFPIGSNNDFNFGHIDINKDEETTKTTKLNIYFIIKFKNTKPFKFTRQDKTKINFYDSYFSDNNQNKKLTTKNITFNFQASFFALTSSNIPTNTQTKFSEVIIVK